MKKSFATLVAVLVTLCTTSTALAETQAPASGATVKVTVLNTPQLHYSVTRTYGTPPDITKLPKNQVIRIGDNLQFAFTFTGSPMPLVKIFHNGKPIPSSDRYKLTVKGYTCTFLIYNVVPKDMGTYTFQLINEFGSAAATVTLEIIN